MEDLNNIHGEFEGAMQAAFGGFQETADADVWNNIEAALAPKKNRVALIWWWGSAAAGIAALFISINLFQSDQIYDQRQSMILTDSVNYDPCLEGDDAPTQTSYALAPSASQNSEENAASISPSSASNSDATTIATSSPQLIAEGSISDYASINTEGASTPVRDARSMLGAMDLLKLGNYWNIDSLKLRAESDMVVFNDEDVDWQDWEEKESDQWALAGNLGSSGGADQSSSTESLATGGGAGLFTDNAVPNSQNLRMSSDLRYQTPFIIGVRGSWGFSKRFSLESGVSYSLLPSVAITESNGAKITNRFNDHFIGVPLLLNFEFLDRKRIGLYTTQGVMIEKGIASRHIQTIESPNASKVKRILPERAPGLQIGFVLGAGVDYRINNQFSLYAEPSVTSWLVNLGVGQNIRNHQILWPSVNVGARFNLN